jgi:hypothetical protein
MSSLTLDSFKYDREKGLSMFVQDRQTEISLEKFEKGDDDGVTVRTFD